MSQQNTSMSICKAIGIILVVVGHAEAPGLLTSFIYLFHMPLFFMASGYFFNVKYLDQPWEFVKRRFVGLYVPFVKWSLLFLLLHNVFFYFGILNESYGNWEGGVTHPYKWNDMLQRLSLILFSMGGYDEFIAGAFWFFRGLLLANIGFLVLFLLLDGRLSWLRGWKTPAIIAVIAVAFVLFRLATGVKIYTLINGGYRETWGMFFVAMGFLYRQFEPRMRFNAFACAIVFAFLVAGAWFHLRGMTNFPKPIDLFLIATGTLGFAMSHYISKLIDARDGWFKRLMIYIGENTLTVFVFHVISFKVVSLLKIWYYNLDFAQVGCHMVIHYNHTDPFWVLYSIAGVAIPLSVLYMLKRLQSRSEVKKSKR